LLGALFLVGVNKMVRVPRDTSPSAATDLLQAVFDKLRADEEVAPSPGFYARVLSRIETVQQQSIWAPLIYSEFRVRLIAVCLSLSLASAAYVLATEWSLNEGTAINAGSPAMIIGSNDTQHRRDAVLTELITYPQSD
jgi:hypothetical protein